MWRRKKFILAGLLAVVLLLVSLGGVALAQTRSGDDSQPKTLLARVAAILGIDQQRLGDAFAQAQSEMRDEALDRYLQNLIDQGKITEEQADQYRAWWQAKPDMAPFQQQLKEWQQARPSLPSELKEWQEARPDIPLPGQFGRLGHPGFRGGMKWGRGHNFWDR